MSAQSAVMRQETLQIGFHRDANGRSFFGRRRPDSAHRISGVTDPVRSDGQRTDHPFSNLSIFVTAAEAFPAFEEALLAARSEIAASFRVFDPQTKLRSPVARRCGETWEDRGLTVMTHSVNVRLANSDIDTLSRPAMPRATTRSVRQLQSLAASVPPGAGRLSVHAARHPAEAGWLMRLVLLPIARKRMGEVADWLNDMDAKARTDTLELLPGLSGLLRLDGDLVAPARWVLPRVYPATHHQKLAVIDGQRLFIGGLDVNERRYDSPDHDRPAEETWHDIQISVDGPAAQDALSHLARFEAETEGVLSPSPQRTLLRTLSRGRATPWALSPRPLVTDLRQRFEAETARARQFIYVETQFLRDRQIARSLARAGRARPELSLVVVLPAAPEGVAFGHKNTADLRFGDGLQVRCLDMLRKAYGSRLALVSPAQPRAGDGDARDQLGGAPIIYVHSKVAIFDDRAAIVSSANLNGRSSAWDTEAGLCLTDTDQVRTLRARLFEHWLGEDAPRSARDPRTIATAWNALAKANATRAPAHRTGFLLPHPTRRARRFGRIIPGIPDEMV